MSNENLKGKFIVFEGIDGSGISTQTANLSKFLESEYGLKTVLAKEPSEGPLGTLIRQVLSGRLSGVNEQSLALLFAADRIDHNHNKIVPALEQGKYVLCDRYLWSSLAYQGINIDRDWIEQINRYAAKPDLTLFIKVRPEISLERIYSTRFRIEIFEKHDILQQVYNNYINLFKTWNDLGEPVIEIDGEQTPEIVQEQIMEALKVSLL